MTLIYLAVFIVSVLLSFALTWNVRNMALARGWVALPSSRRHIHEVPLPRLGGVAIFFSFVTVIALLVVASALFHFPIGLSPQKVFYIILCGTFVFGLGLYDDLRPVNPYIKLAVERLAAVLLFVGGFRVLRLSLLFGWEDFGWAALPLTIIWVLLITNAFNLIDGLDGLAAGSALFSTLTVFIPWRQREPVHRLYVERAGTGRFSESADGRGRSHSCRLFRSAACRNNPLHNTQVAQRAATI